MNALTHNETGGPHPTRNFGIGKPEPAMGVFLAQRLDMVGREIRDNHQTARPQNPLALGQHPGGLVGKMKHLVIGHSIDGCFRERQAVHVGMTHAAMLQVLPVNVCARQTEHLMGEVDADSFVGIRPEQLQHAAGAGSNIDERADLSALEQTAHDRFDIEVGDVEATDILPAFGVGAEIRGRGRGAAAADGIKPRGVAVGAVGVFR